MKYCGLLFLVVGCLLVWSCKNQKGSLEEQLQEELNYIVSSKFDWTPGVSLSVYAPEDSIVWTGTAGVSNLQTNSNFLINQPFRIASVAKTFVAASLLRLQEEGKLNIDDPISSYISAYHDSLLVADGYVTSTITIRHCLTLSAGFYDYAFGTDDTPSPYVPIVLANPQKEWTRTEVLEGIVEWGAPMWKPGEDRYFGGDTEHLILGEIIENVADTSLGAAFDQLLHLDKLGLTSTWQESIQQPENNLPQVSCYYKRVNYSQMNPTANLYSGGLISTTSDLSKFFYHLFHGDVFDNPATLDLMLEPMPFSNGAMDERYRLGVEAKTLYGNPVFGHMGMWDTYAYYFPENEATIVVHFTDGGSDFVIKRVVSILDKYQN